MRRNANGNQRHSGSAALFESLEERRLMSTTFNAQTGALTVVGTSGHDAISITTTTSGIFTLTQVHENGVRTFSSPLRVNTVTVHAQAGNDTVQIGPGVGRAMLYGDKGNDLLVGGEKDDHLDGGPDDDVLAGRGGNDVIVGGLGADELYGDGGNDTLLARDGTRDFVSGGSGYDRAELDMHDDGPGHFERPHEYGGGYYVTFDDIEVQEFA